VNWLKYTSTYDGNNNMIEYLELAWEGSNWVNDHKWTYTYDGNNLIEYMHQAWQGSDWSIHYKYTYSYDGNNNMILSL